MQRQRIKPDSLFSSEDPGFETNDHPILKLFADNSDSDSDSDSDDRSDDGSDDDSDDDIDDDSDDDSDIEEEETPQTKEPQKQSKTPQNYPNILPPSTKLSLNHQQKLTADHPQTLTGTSDSPKPSTYPTALIVGLGVLISVLVTGLIMGLVLWKRRKNRIYSGKGMAAASERGSIEKISFGKSSLELQKKIYCVEHEYKPTLPDELELNVGDRVNVESIYDDGWCKSRNLESGKIGSCPFVCLKEKK